MSELRGPALEGLLAADVMLRDPKTVGPEATVEDVRAMLANPSVQMVLLADEGGAFCGAITAVPDDAPGEARAAAYADAGPEWLAPSASAAEAFEAAARSPHRRVVVLDERDTLVGLVCLNEARTRFCGGTHLPPP